MQKIVVWLDEDYTKTYTFYVSESLTINEIMDEVNKRFEDWYSFDIW